MTIKMRIIIPMIAFTIAASSTVLISNIVQFSHYVGEDIGSRLGASALKAFDRIELLKSQTNAASQYLAKDPIIAYALENNQNDTLIGRGAQLYGISEADFCTITSVDGVIAACTYDIQANGKDVSAMPSVRSALSGKAMTTIEAGKSSGLSVNSTAPVYNEKGEIVGAVTVGYPLDTNEFVDSIKSITGAEATICQGDTRVSTTIFSNGERAVGTRAPSDISEIVLSGEAYKGRAEILYNEMIAEYHPLIGDDGEVIGMLFVGYYTDNETETILAFIQSGIFFMLLFILAFVLIITYISGYIVMPINEAAGVLRQISKGNFDARVEGNYKGDLARIKDSVNSTALELSMYLREKLMAEQAAHESELAKARAEEATATKSKFLASMSHEIRTPMNAIIGMSELLLAEELNDRQRKYVGDIKTSSTALLDIINDILDMSKIEVDRLVITPVDFSLPRFIESIYSMVGYSAKSKGLDFMLETEEPMPLCLHGDDIRLRQILVNLLGNAVKFTEAGYIRFFSSYSNGIIYFEVEDTGIGIREADMERLYNSFEQLDLSKNRNRQGTGLGLSITKSLVELMEGKISASSTYGKGTVFKVQIPIPVGDEGEMNDASYDYGNYVAKGAEVLLVDDNEANLSVGSGLLKLYQIECDTAKSGIEAIQMIREKDYDIVFMDHMMPGIDGVETLARIRALGDKYTGLVIVALTANATSDAREMLLNSGMNDFLTKPINRRDLAKMIRKWLPPGKIRVAQSDSEPIRGGNIETVNTMSCIRKITEIDVDAGLALMGGSEKIYTDTLRIITRMIPEILGALEEFLEESEMGCFAIRIHGIKNSLNTAVSEELALLAQEMETQANAGNISFCKQVFPEFSTKLTSLHRKLHRVFYPDVHEELCEGDTQTLIECLDEIKRFIQEFDEENALNILSTLSGFDFGAEVNGLLKVLNDQLDTFEYQKAEETIGRLEQYF